MLKTIIEREFWSNIITLRFLLGLIVCVGLVATNTVVLLQDHKQKLEIYQRNQQKSLDSFRGMEVYSDIATFRRPEVFKAPKLLSILNEGVDPQMGDKVRTSYNLAPVFAWSSQAQKNPYLGIFPKIDLTLVFQIVISLLALLFAYDSVAGELENGTLALTLSNPVPRGVLLFGKYLGGMLSLVVVLAAGMLIAGLIIFLSPLIQATREQWVQMGFFCLVSLVYVSTLFTLGMLFSTATRRAATALMIAMFFWVVFVVVWPHASVFVVTQLAPLEPSDPVTYDGARRAEVKGAEHFMLDLDRRQWREAGEYGEQHGITSTGPGFRPHYLVGGERVRYLGGSFNGIYTGPPEKEGAFREYFKFRENLAIRLANEVERVQRDYLMNNTVGQHRLALMVVRISPAGTFASATAALAGTDMKSHLHFLDTARGYRAELIQHLLEQKAFSSEKWYNRKAFTKTDMEGIPLFREKPEPLSKKLARATPNVVILITLNVILFLLTFIKFLRYEAR